MTQDSESRPTDVTGRKRKTGGGGAGGLLPGVLAALISGLICWQWLIPSLGTAQSADPTLGARAGNLDPVDEQDITGAIGTLSGSPEFLAGFKDRSKACPRPLAWVSIVSEPGQPAATVRLRSGNYISPLFQLTEVPTRVAVPYPGPYERGTGTLTLVGAGAHVAVALLPVWHVVVQGTDASRNVTWHPVKKCIQPNG